MACGRIPGPLCQIDKPIDVVDGTLPLMALPQPGPVGSGEFLAQNSKASNLKADGGRLTEPLSPQFPNILIEAPAGYVAYAVMIRDVMTRLSRSRTGNAVLEELQFLNTRLVIRNTFSFGNADVMPDGPPWILRINPGIWHLSRIDPYTGIIMTGPAQSAEATMLHELFHVIRYDTRLASTITDLVPTLDPNQAEEQLSVNLVNIYQSEIGQPLRGFYFSEQEEPFINRPSVTPDQFWASPINRVLMDVFLAQQPRLAGRLRAIGTRFNSLRPPPS